MGDISEGLRLLTALSNPRSGDHAAALTALPAAVLQASFVLQMLQIFTSSGVDVALRQLAAVLVKNNCVGLFAQGSTSSSSAAPQGPLIDTLHAALLQGLADPVTEIRKAAASLFGRVVDSYCHSYWAPLVPHLTAVLQLHCEGHVNGYGGSDGDSQRGLDSPEALDGALTAVVVLCEDASEKLQMDPARPLDQLVPLLLALFAHPHEPARHAALTALNALVYDSHRSGPLYRCAPSISAFPVHPCAYASPP